MNHIKILKKKSYKIKLEIEQVDHDIPSARRRGILDHQTQQAAKILPLYLPISFFLIR